ncbi:MAG: bifunctional precorrin-2 dehydrogenase/sirohydrochlorin ferrochelatase [Calditrichaeota bacterium]|nr:bifunctional precorrin-2 dehydrogenase/sirohydrochlorin ferrochelatase [Calditrichota bacterium]
MFLPLFFNTDDLICLVVGGGNVALRKIKILLDSGCDQILVISPIVIPELAELINKDEVAHRHRDFQTGDCMGKHLVISATSNLSVNKKVSEEARWLDIPVNVVDAPELSTVIFPAIERNEPLVLAVSTGGSAPFMAGVIRDKFSDYSKVLSEWVSIASMYREVVLANSDDLIQKRKLYKRFTDAGLLSKSDNPPDSDDLDTWLKWLDDISEKRDNN